MRYARWLVCLLVLAAVLLSWLLPRQQIAPVDISFADTEPVPGYEPDRRETPLKIAMISVLNHQDTARYQKELAEGLGRLLDRPVLLLRRKSYMEINQLLSKGDADIGLLSTGAYCVYGRKEDFALLAMQERNKCPYYYGYVIVSAKSGLQTLDDLRGKRFAYVDPLSYSGYLGLQEKLRKAGEAPEQFFQSVYFTYSHDASIRAVLNDFADGAVVDSLAYEYLQKYEPEQAAGIRIIETLPPRGTSPVVARKGLAGVDRIQDALLHLQDDPEAGKAMEHLLIDRFILPQPDLYPPIEWREREGNG